MHREEAVIVIENELSKNEFLTDPPEGGQIFTEIHRFIPILIACIYALYIICGNL